MKFRNGKLKDLTPQGTLNPNPEAVIDEQFASDDGFFDARDIVQVKYEMLRRVANGQSIAETIRAFGFSSRQVFYRARAAFQQSGWTRRMRQHFQEERRDSSSTLATGFVSEDLEIDFVMRKIRVGDKNV